MEYGKVLLHAPLGLLSLKEPLNDGYNLVYNLPEFLAEYSVIWIVEMFKIKSGILHMLF